MYKVYSNADCNLAAAASRDSSGGLFFERAGLQGQCIAQHVRGEVIDCFADADLFVKEIVFSPLQSRAWVHQEWLMSKRTIHFARNQIFWECDHLCACEVFPDGLPDGIRYRGKKKFADDLENATCLMDRDTRSDTSHVGQDLIHLWLGLLFDYTHRELTKPTDRFPALSGIAKWLQPHLGNPEYLAGVWNNSDLHRQFLWSSDTKNPRPQYRAPSWSWASIDDGIRLVDMPGIFTPQSEILDISTTRGGSDPTGPVTGGHVLIKGNMGRVQIIDHKRAPVLCREDDIKGADNRRVIFRGFDVSGLQFGLYYILHLGTFTLQPSRIHPIDLEEGALFATYLVLRSVTEQDGTFELCGLVDEWYMEDSAYRTLTGRGLQSRQDIPCKEYDEDKRTYRIRIV
ncbi:hypothetical protein LB504_012176 [Fusarium proliferatum]|nr:hypothetical protein LB504_012176 [Fusarium proliferatum]